MQFSCYVMNTTLQKVLHCDWDFTLHLAFSKLEEDMMIQEM